MDISYFQKINNMYGTSIKKESDLYSIKKQVSLDFEDNLLAFQVTISDEIRTVLIMDSSKTELKKLIARPEENMAVGDIVLWNQEPWIIIDKEPNVDIYNKGYIKKCLTSLKWIDSQGNITESWFTYKSDPSTSVGIHDGRVLTMPNERRNVYIPSNEHTRKIKKDKRFIFDNRAWKVVNIDGLRTGLINLILEEDLINTSKDNMELRIADYWSTTSEQQQEPSNSVLVNINGLDECKVNQTQTYTIYETSVAWSLLSDDESSETDLATIIDQNSNNCTIRANNKSKFGYVRLVAKSGGSEKYVKRIKIRNLF